MCGDSFGTQVYIPCSIPCSALIVFDAPYNTVIHDLVQAHGCIGDNEGTAIAQPLEFINNQNSGHFNLYVDLFQLE